MTPNDLRVLVSVIFFHLFKPEGKWSKCPGRFYGKLAVYKSNVYWNVHHLDS